MFFQFFEAKTFPPKIQIRHQNFSGGRKNDVGSSREQGCQIILGAANQNIPNYHKIYQMATKYTN
jgi:hypothetical protein